MKELNNRYEEIVCERYEENAVSGKAAVNYIEKSTALYKGSPVPCLYMPKLFSEPARAYLSEAVDTMYAILNKVIRRYLDDDGYRKLFPFSRELEELILTEAGYPCLLPIARLDIFLNEDNLSFQFCEFNADGTSAMNEDREINIAVSESDAFLEMRKEYELTSFELFDSWVRVFRDIYAQYERKVSSPRVVIADFMEHATPNEFVIFRDAFRKAGYEADICEIRDLVYRNGNSGGSANTCNAGVLETPDGKKVDAIYRRAVTRDVMACADEAAAFLQAVRDGAVCLIGHFRTQVIHNKAIFMILRKPETLSFLTESEREFILRHIPETFWLSVENIRPQGETSGHAVETFDLGDVLTNKDKWIIKPEDGYASNGVFIGVDLDEAEWKKAVTGSMDTGYLLQRYCPPYRALNIDFNTEDRPDFKMYLNTTGMFVYNGKLQGFYSRAGLKGDVSTRGGAFTMASLLAVEREDDTTTLKKRE
ncbi:MAG: hypothetical protein FWE27_09480 [Defluviitaleaceae bacterium]|nr:hypothetical protein [Defluviitaleaceae bacterium]